MATFLPSYPNTLTMSQINSVFQGRGNNLNAYRGTTYYTSGGGPYTFPSGTIAFSNFHGTGPDPAYSANYAGASVHTGLNQTHTTTMYININGTIDHTTTASYDVSDMPKNWYLPTTGGIGSGYYWRYTYSNNSGTPPNFTYNNGATAAAPNTWYSLSTYGRVQLTVNVDTGYVDGLITLETSNNASTVLYTGVIYWTQNESNLP